MLEQKKIVDDLRDQFLRASTFGLKERFPLQSSSNFFLYFNCPIVWLMSSSSGTPRRRDSQVGAFGSTSKIG